MTEEEHFSFYKSEMIGKECVKQYGWCWTLRDFVSFRYILENKFIPAKAIF